MNWSSTHVFQFPQFKYLNNLKAYLRAPKARARGATWERKYGNPSVRENLVLGTVRPPSPPCMTEWPVSKDHTADSSLELLEVSCFYFLVDRWPATGFQLYRRLNLNLYTIYFIIHSFNSCGISIERTSDKLLVGLIAQLVEQLQHNGTVMAPVWILFKPG